MKKSNKKKQQKDDSGSTEHSSEEMMNLMIGLHTFPLESEEDLEESQRKIEEIKSINNNIN